MMSAIMLIVTMLSVATLNVVMLNVEVPSKTLSLIGRVNDP
jgi:hypothetical protein